MFRLSCAELFAMDAATDISSFFFLGVGLGAGLGAGCSTGSDWRKSSKTLLPLPQNSGMGVASGSTSTGDGVGGTGRLFWVFFDLLFLLTSLNIPTRMTPAIKRNFKKIFHSVSLLNSYPPKVGNKSDSS